MYHHESAAAIQRVVRGFLGRLEALRRVNVVYEKIYDPKTGAHYYYNTDTFETAWHPPAVVTRILGEFGDLNTISPSYTEEEAAVMVQTAWRRFRGLRIARTLLASVVSKTLDESTGAYYYFNSLTGETSWEKPTIFGSQDVKDFHVVRALVPGTTGGEDSGQEPESTDSFGTRRYGYDNTEDNQEWAVHQASTSSVDYEGWVWDESLGWVYGEGQSCNEQTHDDFGATATRSSSDKKHEEASQSGSEKVSSSDGEESGNTPVAAGDDRTRRLRNKIRRHTVAPRRYPRSRAQRLVDEAEDSLDGARPSALDLSMLGLKRVTSRVYEFEWLEMLDLSGNKLTRISPDMGAMRSLAELNLRYNRISAIPGELEALTCLKHLLLSHNKISGFRENIYLIRSLETLDLGHNRLEEIAVQEGSLELLKRAHEWEVGLGLLKELRTLDIGYNRLKKWPAQVERCRKLRDLRLGHNELQEVPALVGDNTALTNLDLGSNKIIDLPDTLNSLSSLTFLDLSNNNLETVSILPLGKERGMRLVSLEVLRLENNSLTEGPAAVETLTGLTELNISNNPITGWTPDVSRLRKLEQLLLSGVNLDQFPAGLQQLNKLQTLDLSENNISKLNSSTSYLFKLRTLDLKGNKIKDLGPSVGNLLSLTHLDASHNGLEDLPPELARCTALEYLDVSGGMISALSTELSKLTRLRCLRVQDHRLKHIPPSFKSLTKLQDLRLGGNKLDSLPDSLHILKKMRFAELSGNMFRSPPPVTRQWPELTHLILSRNPLEGRQPKSRHMLKAARQGHDAMNRGEWEEAVRHLHVAAQAYEDAIRVVPDFPDSMGQGSPLARTRAQDVHTFHHENLGVARLQRARAITATIKELEKKESSKASLESNGNGSTSVGNAAADGLSLGLSSQKVDLLSAQETRSRHYNAAAKAFEYADELEQLSRPMGWSAGICLLKAAVASDVGNPAHAVNNLERASTRLKSDRAKVRILLAKSCIELGLYARGIADCRVAERFLNQEQEEQEKKKAKERAVHVRMVANNHGAEDVAARQGDREASIVESDVAPDARRRSTSDMSGEGMVGAVVPGEGYTLGRDKPAMVTSDNITQSSQSGSKLNVEDPEFQGQEVEMEDMAVSANINSADKAEETPLLVDLPIADATVAGFCSKERDEQNRQDEGNVADASSAIAGREDLESSVGLLPKEQRPIVVRTSESSRIKIGGEKGGRKAHNSTKETADYERFKLARREIAALVAQAEEGLEFINQSVDMADILRGFTINKHGVPVHDIPTEREHLLAGRSALRDRFRRVQVAEAAKDRDRARERDLTDRCLRDIKIKQQECFEMKARKEAAMIHYRDIEDHCEKEQEKGEAAKNIPAFQKPEEDVGAKITNAVKKAVTLQNKQSQDSHG